MAQDDGPWMPAAAFGRSLKGFGVNLLVRDVDRSVDFLRSILSIEPLYADRDFAAYRRGEVHWMLHADGTYREHPLLALTGDGALRGAGAELQLYDLDPDAAEARARAAGFTVLAPCRDKPHGLRECYIADPDGYVWVPSRPLEP